MFKLPLNSIRKMYRLSLMSVLPYSLSLAMLYILIEPKTKPTFSDSTDWMALALFILGLFGVCILHACIIYQVVNSIKQNSEDSADNNNLSKNEKQQDTIFTVLFFGVRKMIPVFIMSLCYVILVAFGLVAFVIPGVFLFIAGSMSLFIIVLKDTNPKDAFVESYRMIAPHWISLGITMIGLVFFFTVVEIISNWIFTEQVVFSTLFSVLVRGFLWPIAYVTMITLFSEFSSATVIADSPDSKPSRRNRKQKFLRTAPNQ